MSTTQQPLAVPNSQDTTKTTVHDRPDIAGNTGSTTKQEQEGDAHNKDPSQYPSDDKPTVSKAGPPPGQPASPPQPRSQEELAKEDHELHPNGQGNEKPEQQGYPEQIHAGKVGYGPHYAEVHGHATVSERLGGVKKEFKGKITHNTQLVQEGRDIRTGEAKRREQESGDPFATADGEDKKKPEGEGDTKQQHQ